MLKNELDKFIKLPSHKSIRIELYGVTFTKDWEDEDNYTYEFDLFKGLSFQTAERFKLLAFIAYHYPNTVFLGKCEFYTYLFFLTINGKYYYI